MAKKRFLIENDTQVWPITRADCVYHVSGNELLSTVVDKIAADLLAEAKRAKAAEEAMANRIGALEGLMAEDSAIRAMITEVYSKGKNN